MVVACLIFILCLGMVTAYAANPNGLFKGFTKVLIEVNGMMVKFDDVPAFMIADKNDAKTVLPLKEVGETLNAMVEWDTDTYTANIVKPNVHILLSQTSEFKEVEGIPMFKPFSLVRSGSTYSFVIYTEIDNLPKKEYQVKVVLENSEGTVLIDSDEKSNNINHSVLSSFIFKKTVNDFSFKEKGTYKIKIMMKRAGTKDSFVSVGEKTISAY